MIDISRLKIGDKVHYVPFKGCNPSQYENGMVKDIPQESYSSVKVVYNCGGDWNNFKNYTASSTPLSKLRIGWKH